MLYIASDHGGFKLKEHLKKWLTKQKMPYTDLGPNKLDSKDDYPDYAAKVGQKVSRNPINDQGVLICRSGQGMCIVANKFKYVRAGLVWNAAQAKASRNDDMTNIVCLPSDYISPRSAEHVLATWLDTPYSSNERHLRRVKKISKIESPDIN